MTSCAICGSPLSEPEIRLNRIWHYDCNKCQICGEGPLETDLIVKCLSEGHQVSHTVCLKTKLFQDFKTKVLPVTKAHIDALNEEICSFFPAVNPDTTDVTLLYNLLISLQETATNVSYCLSLTKDKLLVRESRTFDTQQKIKREIEKATHIQSETEKLATQKRTAMFAAERENPALRHRRKAIEGFMAIGMSEAQAIEAVERNAQQNPPKGEQIQ